MIINIRNKQKFSNMKATRITDKIWRFPDQLFYGEVVNTWLINDEDKIIIVDGPTCNDSNLRFVKSFSKDSIILLTHSPCLGEAEKLRKLLGTKIIIHKEAKKLNLNFSPDKFIKDEEVLSKNTTVIFTPGHKPEHSCLFANLDHGNMFTGDSIQGNEFGKIIDPYEEGTDVNTQENIQSLKKLLNYKFERILPFHYFPILSSASSKLKRALLVKE